MEERTEGWKSSPAITGLILLATLLSPVGGPFLWFVTMVACDVPWEGPYQCVVPEPVFTYFFLSYAIPFFVAGYFALAWFALCIAALVTAVRLFGKALWDAVEPHL